MTTGSVYYYNCYRIVNQDRYKLTCQTLVLYIVWCNSSLRGFRVGAGQATRRLQYDRTLGSPVNSLFAFLLMTHLKMITSYYTDHVITLIELIYFRSDTVITNNVSLRMFSARQNIFLSHFSRILFTIHHPNRVNACSISPFKPTANVPLKYFHTSKLTNFND